MSRIRRVLLGMIACLAMLYVGFAGFVFWSMHQTPEVFGRIMARMPQPVVFLLLPFETFWEHARSGDLKAGDPAPDFSLKEIDKSEFMRLSELNRQRPVVLVFGSYT